MLCLRIVSIVCLNEIVSIVCEYRLFDRLFEGDWGRLFEKILKKKRDEEKMSTSSKIA
jgi:hypothetical protein